MTKDFTTRLGGALLSALVDATLEAVWVSNPAEYSGKIPYVPTVDPLPPADDWVPLAVSAPVYVYGRYARKKKVKTVGEGALAYSGAMVLARTVSKSRIYFPPYV